MTSSSYTPEASTPVGEPPQDRVRELVAEFWQAEIEMHPVYGSTSACGGGIGGSTITEHCAHLCQSPKHDAARERFEAARVAIWQWLKEEQKSVSPYSVGDSGRMGTQDGGKNE